MATLDTRVSPSAPGTVRADVAEVGEVLLVGPNRIPVMRTNQPGGGSPRTYQFVSLGKVADVSPGTLFYYEGATEMFTVSNAELDIKR